MKSKFINHFSNISPLSTTEANAIRESMRIKTYKKGTQLLKEGQVPIDTYFVLEGCIREYIITDGEEKTTAFYTEEQWVISLNNFSGPSPSNYNLT